uniref:Myb-like domain-containing protein n=1 Tax=Zea mays TaxID=4577 RepID=A0A804R693_MAIZE
MERQNAMPQEKAKKVEYARVRTLVDNVYKKDPKIQMRKEEQKAEKQRRKEAKYLTKKLQEEEATRAAEEERVRKEEESKKVAEAALHQKKVKEKEKKLLRKEKTRLCTLAAPVVADSHFGMSKEDVESTCASLDMEQLKKLCDGMDGKDAAENARMMSNALRNESSSKEEKKIEANSVECPGGAVVVLRAVPGFFRGDGGDALVASLYLLGHHWEASCSLLHGALEGVNPVHPWTCDGGAIGVVPSLEAPHLRLVLVRTASSKAPQPASSQTANGKAVVDPVPDEAPSVADPDAWTEAQVLALLQALKAFPKDASQRWERVAAAVPGKTVVQCKKKVAAMRDNLPEQENWGID